MSVFGGSIYRSKLRRYLGLLLVVQLAASPVFFALLAGTAFAFRVTGMGSQLTPALVGVAFAAPAILILWFSRRALYLEYLSGRSSAGAILYCCVLFTALAILRDVWKLSALSAFVVMGLAALTASVFLLVRIRPQFPQVQFREELMDTAKEHWKYGRWALASSFFIWVPWNLYYTVVSSFSGLAAAGELRALLNLALPMTQTYAALALLMLPRAASIAQDQGWPGARREALHIASVFTAIALLYWSVVIIYRVQLLGFLYSGHYGEIARLIPWLAIASIASGTVFGPLCAFRAMHSPSIVCWIYTISSVVSAVIAIPATRWFGLKGTMLGIVAANVLALLIATFWLMRFCRAPEVRPGIGLADCA
jgi:O-antigen/teichoic acid export membrane protein